MTSDITKDDLFRAVLALDVYHRGYNSGLDTGYDTAGTKIGHATVGEVLRPDRSTSAARFDENIGFYALEYTLNGQP